MIKNYFTQEQLVKFIGLVGQKLDGFYLNGKVYPYSHIYEVLVATDGNVLHFKTDTAREGVEQQ